MANELSVVLEYIEREKGIDKAIVVEAIEAALLSAARKRFGETAVITVAINAKTGQIDVNKDGESVRSDEFGRIAAQTARQIIMQKIREAEREIVFQSFQAKVGDITNGIAHRFEKGTVIVDLGKTEGVLAYRDLLPKEEYKQGARVRALIVEVRKTNRGPQIVLSRTNPGFVKRLFELEVPEIYEGIVEIRAIARMPGERTKIAVASTDDKVDSVGACVGVRGSRIKNIVRELHGEKVDIIRWSDDIREFVREAMKPAKISSLDVLAQEKKVEIDVDEDQLSLAIGKRGQNVRLAAQLVGWEITIRGREPAEAQLPLSEGEAGEIIDLRALGEDSSPETGGDEAEPAGVDVDIQDLAELGGISDTIKAALVTAGYRTLEALAQAAVEQLVSIAGIGEKRAEKIIAAAKQALQ
ncbi:MAG: transcription termination factor NusA [Candidatus Omnitrophica bacterium]|nr:transcription termination factor NusA [Candidatus Omnitrophota bacterium]